MSRLDASRGWHGTMHGRVDNRKNPLNRHNYPVGNISSTGQVRGQAELGYDPRKLEEIRQRAIRRQQIREQNARIAAEEVAHRAAINEARADQVVREDSEDYDELVREQDALDNPKENGGGLW